MNLNKKHFLLFGIFLFSLQINVKSQIVLLHEDVKADSVVSRFGPNRTHYLQMYYGAGFILGNSDSTGADIKPWKSYYLSAGFRYKLKLGKYYAIGLDAAYQYNSFRLKQNPTNFLPDTFLHKKERLNFHNLSASFFNRINFKKRGDIIGNYLDFGCYADYIFSSTHYYRDATVLGNVSRETAVHEHKLQYVNNYDYGFFARIGWEGFAFWGQYRVSDLFDKNYNIKYPELPRIFIGIEVSSL